MEVDRVKQIAEGLGASKVEHIPFKPEPTPVGMMRVWIWVQQRRKGQSIQS